MCGFTNKAWVTLDLRDGMSACGAMIEPSHPYQEPSAPRSNASGLREQALSHFLLWDLVRSMWQAGRYDIEVLKAEVDRGGYDAVIEAAGVVRHIQLKSSFAGSRVREVSVSARLLAKPAGCVVRLEVDRHTLALQRYLWFPDTGEENPC